MKKSINRFEKLVRNVRDVLTEVFVVFVPAAMVATLLSPAFPIISFASRPVRQS